MWRTGAILAAVPVEVVHVLNRHGVPVEIKNPDSLAEALSLLVALISIAAVFLAVESAKAAKKSANLAEDTLGIMQEEAEATRAERARRADPNLSVEAEATNLGIVLILAFRNEGNRPAERLMVNFLVPDALNVTIIDRRGHLNPEQTAEEVHWTDELLKGSDDGCDYLAVDMGPVDPVAMNKLQRLLVRAKDGEWELKGVLIHPDLPTNERTWTWLLRIDDASVAVEALSGPEPPLRPEFLTAADAR